jgi:RNA polymerase II subunit A C-terminal domain phosphatase SSU72
MKMEYDDTNTQGSILWSSLSNLIPEQHSYTQNGILHMLDRNRRIKPMPERFQACKEKFNVIITCEERVYDQVIEGRELLISSFITPTILDHS